VLVAVDFSEASKSALRYGKALAKQFGASLVALHVVEPVSVEADFGYGAFTRQMPNQTELAHCQARLGVLGKKLPGAGSHLSAITRSGCVHDEIIRAAKEMDVDLILLGSQSDPIEKKGPFCGTVQKVLGRAPCPVLVVGANK